MKGLERFILVVFSIIIITLSIGLILVSTEMINMKDACSFVQKMLVENKMTVLISGSILALFGLIGLFSTSENSDNMKSGLAIKSETGTVYITKDTFESIIIGVTRSYAEIRNVKVDMIVSETGVVVNVFAMILPDTIVPSLTSKLQENIKSSVLKQTTVEIKEVNLKIKGVYLEPQKK